MHYTDDFKRQIVKLVNEGMEVKNIALENNISRSAIYKWIDLFSNDDSSSNSNLFLKVDMDTSSTVDEFEFVINNFNIKCDSITLKGILDVIKC